MLGTFMFSFVPDVQPKHRITLNRLLWTPDSLLHEVPLTYSIAGVLARDLNILELKQHLFIHVQMMFLDL